MKTNGFRTWECEQVAGNKWLGYATVRLRFGEEVYWRIRLVFFCKMVFGFNLRRKRGEK